MQFKRRSFGCAFLLAEEGGATVRIKILAVFSIFGEIPNMILRKEQEVS